MAAPALTRGAKGTVRPAGVKNYGADDSAAAALDFGGRPSTPERLRRFRVPAEPGVRVRPAGPMRDDKVDDTQFFGQVKPKDVPAAQAMDNSMTPLQEYEAAEAVYRTAARERLGQSYSYQSRPAKTADPGFAFGKPSGRSGITTKELTCPVDHPEYEEAEKVYKKSHGAFAPGEQRTRMVDWSRARVDPSSHRFGVVARHADAGGVSKCLDPDTDALAPAAKVIPRRVAAARMFSTDQVGKPRALGLAAYKRAPPDSFGRPPASGDTWGAAECLRGDFTEEEMMPDADLGKATRPGFRNTTTDPDRVFGIPSLRTDVPPRNFSIAEPQNFGQDAPLKSLVNPSRFMTRGVDHSDFAKKREVAELRELFDSIGYSYLSAGAFAAIYQRAAERYDVTEPGSVSAEEFKRALADYLEVVEDTGEEPEWCRAGAGAAAAEAE
ncbi:Efhb [Symbiodinium sp. KB8]|nr:Efhb [Symbiodinium sp. KB8]